MAEQEILATGFNLEPDDVYEKDGKYYQDWIVIFNGDYKKLTVQVKPPETSENEEFKTNDLD